MKREILLLPLLAALLCSGACARHDSDAEREAEISRRVDERLAAEHAAREKAELDQRAASLAERERRLASREVFFATMTASVATDPANDLLSSQNDAADPAYDQRGSYSSDDNADAVQSGVVVPGSVEFDPRPQITDDYLFDDPYSYGYGYAVPYVTVINQNSRVVNRQRHSARRPGMRGHGHAQPATNPGRRPAVVPRPTSRPPRQNAAANRPPRPQPARPIMKRTPPPTAHGDPTGVVDRARRNPR